MPLKITPSYRSQSDKWGSTFFGCSINTPKAGLFKTLYRLMMNGTINDENLLDVKTWQQQLIQAAVDQVVSCEVLFRKYEDFDGTEIQPTLNADELYRHILIATGLDIDQQDIEPVLVDIDLEATPIFMDEERRVLNPIYSDVIAELITKRVDLYFTNELKAILTKDINIVYPEAQPEFQVRPLHPMIEADLRLAAQQTNNQTILYFLTAKLEDENFREDILSDSLSM